MVGIPPPRHGHGQKHHLPWRVNAARKRNQELAAASTPAPRSRPPTPDTGDLSAQPSALASTGSACMTTAAVQCRIGGVSMRGLAAWNEVSARAHVYVNIM